MAEQTVQILLTCLTGVATTLAAVVYWIGRRMLAGEKRLIKAEERCQKSRARLRRRVTSLEIKVAKWGCGKSSCDERCPVKAQPKESSDDSSEDDSDDSSDDSADQSDDSEERTFEV